MLKELDIYKIFTILKLLRRAITTTCNSHDKIKDKDHMVTVILNVPSRIIYQLFKKQGAFNSTHFLGKPGSWFVLAKCVKKQLRKSDVSPASLLKTSFFHRCFSHILVIKTNNLVCP